MLKKIAYFIIAIFLPFCFSLFSYQAFAEEEATRPQDVCEASIDPELRQSFGCEDFEDNNTLPITITNIVKNIIVVSGLVAVVFIIIGGITYISSEGDSGKTKKAKDTILYAAIGLVICSLAFVIVNWTIDSILKQNAEEQSPDQNEKIEETPPDPSLTTAKPNRNLKI
ncbi:hypothetical protein IKF04_00980 [Candidatus Saccharibacteria bacterium]|nr:hypothetical protein [Candidatus Saccharibacteria bacterium]